MFPDGFWSSEIWKEAARAGLRQISQMVTQGNLAGASRLATTPGVLKPSLAGSQIKHLGRGGEGLATMVAHPDHGVAVRKLYDPRGISGPDMIARKEQAGRALGDNPTFSRFLGASQTPQGGQMHFNEYVQPGKAPTGQAGAQSIQHAQTQAQKSLTQAGFAGGKDIRQGNMIYDAQAGQHRVIDYMPAQKGEFLRMPKSKERFLVPASGSGPLNDSYNPQQSDTNGGMLGRLLGGRSKPGGLREDVSSLGNATNAARPMAKGTPPIQPHKPLAPATTPLTPASSERTTPMPPLGQSAPATVALKKPPTPDVTAPIRKPSSVSI